MEVQNAMQEARRVYFAAIEKQKKKHYQEFLNNNQNVWRALKYLDSMSKGSTLLLLLLY